MRHPLPLLVVAAVLLAVAGCGDDEPVAEPAATSTTPTTTATTTAPGAAADVVREHGLPGFAVARVSADGDVSVDVAGQRSHDDPTPLGADAPFHLGSDTKAMTAVLLGTFVDEGRLDLDATLGELFADLQLDDPIAEATLRDVLGHRAGLGDDRLDLAALHAATDGVAARADAVATALRSPASPPGGFTYANVNYMVAGVVAERLGSAPWEQLLRERVFEPLGMACGFGAPVGPEVPLGHVADGTPIPDDAPVADNPPALGPAGTVHCTMADWAAFVQASIAAMGRESTAVLSDAAAAELFDDEHDYLVGWSRGEVDGEAMYSHDGSNTLWYARAVLRPERGEALLLASNTGEQAAVTAMNELTQAFVEA